MSTCGHVGPSGKRCAEDAGHGGVSHGDGSGLRWIADWRPRGGLVSTDDVAECRGCGRTIFRTNIDGRWHHPGAVTDHNPTPREDPRDRRRD